MATETVRFSRLLGRYERARALRAARAVGLVVPALLVVALVSPRLWLGLTGAGAAAAAAWVALWRGRSAARGVWPGLVAAVAPLLASHVAARIGHICTPDGCTSLCMPMCAGGGLVAGLVLSELTRRDESPVPAFVVGATVAVAIGATGCTCVGLGGVAGVALGMSAGMVRSVAMSLRRPSAG
ncbi:MAG: hypothetical protein H6698_02215 [Myxococcales bacterium]|nr:hypothetical protein [Myxococcales bacterium]MCB9519963.1 hypothetical protein [Myxococcales bacterium]MCB9532510.1 hypothetical protein [Myxococcales bacterium]MCB9533126.1 hypothetical protein [Myxococcales bacterium]